MSRIATMPVDVPDAVEIRISEDKVTVTGPIGTLDMEVHDSVEVEQEGQKLRFVPREAVKSAMAQTGTARALVANMVEGVTKGFVKELQLVGVGYRVENGPGVVKLALGYSHSIVYEIPNDVEVDVPTPTRIVVKGADKQRVGQVASELRSYRPPEPYKGKGVRYTDEFVVRKEAKKKQ